MDLRAEKEHLRHSIKERMDRMNARARSEESRSLCRRVLEHLPKEPGTIALFFPMPSEADIAPLFPALLQSGWHVFLPRFEGSSFAFRELTSDLPLEPGKYGLQEPPYEATLLDITLLTLALIPGIAFDRQGNRLGRGNGGFDRWLAELKTKNPSAETWGVAFECQIVDQVPMEPHDRRVDALCLARGVEKVAAE